MKIRITLLLLICMSTYSFAQIGIGTTDPDASAVLDMTSTTQGVLIPRMTTAQREAIASPAVGLQVYDTDTNTVWLFNGAAWSSNTGGGKFVDGNTTDIAYYEGRVGIGRDNFSAAHKLWVESVRSTNGPNTVARFIGSYEGTGASTSTYGATFDVTNESTGTISYGIASYNTVSNNSTGTVTVAEPTRSEINNAIDGTIDYAIGNSSVIGNDGTISESLIGNYIIYYGSGTVENSYAIYIGSGFNKGTVDNYAIKSDSNADSYFEGNIGLGVESPQRKLHISEAMRIEPQATEPTGGSLGDLYVNTNGNLYFHDGTQWKQVQLN